MSEIKSVAKKRTTKTSTKPKDDDIKSLLKNIDKMKTKLEKLRAKIDAGETLEPSEIAALNAALRKGNDLGASW